MSTNIAHGFRLPKQANTLTHLETWLERTSTLLQEVAQSLHQKAMADEAVQLCDRFLLESAGISLHTTDLWPVVPPSPWDSWGAQAHLHRAARLHGNTTPEHEREAPMDVEVFLALDHDGRVYGLLHVQEAHDTLRQTFWDQSGIEAYPYWTHSDRPEGIGLKAWEARGATWARLVDHRGRLKPFVQAELVSKHAKLPSFAPLADQVATGAERVELWTRKLLTWRMDREMTATGTVLQVGQVHAHIKRLNALLDDPNHPWRQDLQPLVQAALDCPLGLDDLTDTDPAQRQRQGAAARARVAALRLELQVDLGVAVMSRPRI